MGHNWDVFTTDSPYDAVLEGLPTQLALALRRLGFAAPGNLATFVDEYEGPETDLEQAVSGGGYYYNRYWRWCSVCLHFGRSQAPSPWEVFSFIPILFFTHSFFASSPFFLSLFWSYRSSGFYRREKVRVRCWLAAGE